MALSWNEIKGRAVKFSKEWKDTTNEEADVKPFLEVFEIPRKKLERLDIELKSYPMPMVILTYSGREQFW